MAQKLRRIQVEITYMQRDCVCGGIHGTNEAKNEMQRNIDAHRQRC